MGKYVNNNISPFRGKNGRNYIDKSGLIAYINSTLDNPNRFTCVTRPRRFGKTMAAAMLRAYYSKALSTREIFQDLEIARISPELPHLNKYNILSFSVTEFVANALVTGDPNQVRSLSTSIKTELLADLYAEFPHIKPTEDESVLDALYKVVEDTGDKFIMIIDEWDCILREFEDSEVRKRYIAFLRTFFKTSYTDGVLAGVYMTGILPIIKLNTDSGLNDFWEYTVHEPMGLEEYFGFTPDEVKALCERNDVDYESMCKWYDGYTVGKERHIFNPNSVITAIDNDSFGSYWSVNRSYNSIRSYIEMNYDGLKDTILNLLGGGRCKVNTRKFLNDLSKIKNRDDVLTALILLGYLSYDPENKEAFVPNLEVSIELANAVEDSNYGNIAKALGISDDLLDYTLDMDEERVASAIDLAHDTEIPSISYNNEQSLATVVMLAYYSARDYYHIHREYPTGKGFADIVFIPYRNVSKPALVVELKFEASAEAAIAQIKERNYPDSLSRYSREILLVGINYDKKTRKHSCRIEKWSRT